MRQILLLLALAGCNSVSAGSPDSGPQRDALPTFDSKSDVAKDTDAAVTQCPAIAAYQYCAGTDPNFPYVTYKDTGLYCTIECTQAGDALTPVTNVCTFAGSNICLDSCSECH
jgi:hypothetical protein